MEQAGGYDDEWALAILYDDVALLVAAAGSAESALRLVGAAESTRARLGSPRATDVQAQVYRSRAALPPILGAAFDGLLDSGRHLFGH
ncbi:MAG: hypothetical protein H0T46_15940 [Deltaproteobacteria bacterium]|nr:hypothetical protein [Deltaproteobacteria bacterium]